MQKIEILKLQNTEDTRNSVTAIFVDAYYKDLCIFSKNKEVLNAAFKNSFLLDHFYGAYLGAKLAGIYALTDEKERCIRIVKKDFIKSFGFIKGTLIAMALKSEFEHPLTLQEEGFFIEAVAVAEKFQGQGVGKAMMQHAITVSPYLELDVTDANIRAKQLYEKIGFRTFKEVAEKHFKKAKGFTKRYYMQYRRSK
ncbi:MAG: GNAT family N-acetyltransferase [Fibrobacter sp.]|nr:GNAT family N-acetyltransferase [Fibrobacter sp.]